VDLARTKVTNSWLDGKIIKLLRNIINPDKKSVRNCTNKFANLFAGSRSKYV
jgi:hypothetical protein